MRLYSDRRAQLYRQFAGDACAILWTVLAVRVALWVYRHIDDLRGGGDSFAHSATGLRDSLASAADKADRVPVAGDALRGPFDSAADAAEGMARAGERASDAIHITAIVLATATFVLPMFVVLVWVLWRARWARRRRAADVLLSLADDRALFALRALAGAPLGRLASVARALEREDVSRDLVTGWREREPRVINALAELELRSLGLPYRP
jgi:hypothetical protein